jgi:hypothetical protein
MHADVGDNDDDVDDDDDDFARGRIKRFASEFGRDDCPTIT